MHSTNGTVMTFSGADPLDLTYQNTLDAAEYDYEMYNVSIVFTLEDELKNSGEPQVLSLIEAKIKQAEMSISERLNADLYTGTAADGEVIGLDTILSTTTEIGSISGSANSFWQANVDSTGETLSIADMRTIKNSSNLGNGGSNVSLIATTQTLYEKYNSLLTANYQMNPLVKKPNVLVTLVLQPLSSKVCLWSMMRVLPAPICTLSTKITTNLVCIVTLISQDERKPNQLTSTFTLNTSCSWVRQ